MVPDHSRSNAMFAQRDRLELSEGPYAPIAIAYLSDRVGDSAVCDLGRARAVRLVGGNDLSGVLGSVGGRVSGRIRGRDASGESNSGNSELHFD